MPRRSSKVGRIPSDLEALIDALDDIAGRLRKIESPSGEALSSTVAKLQALVSDIQDQLDAWTASRWTNSQIQTNYQNYTDAKVANPGNISPGDVSSGGTISAPAINSSGNMNVSGYLFSPAAYGFDITYTRRAAWLGNDGRLAWASSSRTKKCDFRPATIDVDAVLSIEPTTFLYRREVQRRTDLRINEGVDYMPKRETGLIAEDLVDAGLDAFVTFSENGEPEGIEYQMLTVALLAVDKAQQARIDALESRIAAIEQASG